MVLPFTSTCLFSVPYVTGTIIENRYANAVSESPVYSEKIIIKIKGENNIAS